MDNPATALAPVEHRVTFLGKDPAMRDGWRIRCECGWTEKHSTRWSPYNQGWFDSQIRYKLMFWWECHVYTPEERLLLQELGG
jgi:hypothetical protein